MWPEVRTRAFLGRDAGMTSRECPLRCPYNLVQRNESRVARSTWYLILSHHSSDSRVLVGPAAAPSMPNCFACCCTFLSVVLRPRSTAVCLLCHTGPHCVEPTLAGPTFMRIYLRSSYTSAKHSTEPKHPGCRYTWCFMHTCRHYPVVQRLPTHNAIRQAYRHLAHLW